MNKPSLAIKISSILLLIIGILSISNIFENIQLMKYLDAAWMLFYGAIEIFIAWGMYKLKKWALQLGLLSQLAFIANMIIFTPSLFAVIKTLPSGPNDEVFLIVSTAVFLGALLPFIFITTTLILKRKDFIY